MREKIFNELKILIQEIDQEKPMEIPNENVNLVSDLGFDSLQLMTLIVHIESKYDIEIMDFEKMSIVSEIINMILESK